MLFLWEATRNMWGMHCFSIILFFCCPEHRNVMTTYTVQQYVACSYETGIPVKLLPWRRVGMFRTSLPACHNGSRIHNFGLEYQFSTLAHTSVLFSAALRPPMRTTGKSCWGLQLYTIILTNNARKVLKTARSGVCWWAEVCSSTLSSWQTLYPEKQCILTDNASWQTTHPDKQCILTNNASWQTTHPDKQRILTNSASWQTMHPDKQCKEDTKQSKKWRVLVS